jgi:hypothetical protein
MLWCCCGMSSMHCCCCCDVSCGGHRNFVVAPLVVQLHHVVHIFLHVVRCGSPSGMSLAHVGLRDNQAAACVVHVLLVRHVVRCISGLRRVVVRVKCCCCTSGPRTAA